MGCNTRKTNKIQTKERKRPYMASTTEIASQVVVELDKTNASCDKKGRPTIKKQGRALLKEAMGKQNNS